MDYLAEDAPLNGLPAADAIFVFGHYEPAVIAHAAGLWAKGKASRLVITGKGGLNVPLPFATEADYYASLAMAAGVPEEAIILEKEASNALENCHLGMKACYDRGFKPERLILCSIPFMLRRAAATFRRQFPAVTVWPSAFAMSKEWWANPRRPGRLVAEIDRLVNYSEKGDIVPVVIPSAVAEAVKKIRVTLG